MRKQTITDPGLLYFGRGNSKLPDNVATFSIPAGYTCPGALDCYAKFDRIKKKLIDGPHQKHRCFAASLEAARSSVRVSTDRNWQRLKTAGTVEKMAALIKVSLPPTWFDGIRTHASGDYYSLNYMLAWAQAAISNPDRLFYAYTKSLPFWVELKKNNMIPPNMLLTASRGGKYDKLIDEHGLREAVVVLHPEEAEEQGLEIDHDDSMAMNPDVHKFALLIHGIQKPGTAAAAATKRLRKENIKYAYTRKK